MRRTLANRSRNRNGLHDRRLVSRHPRSVFLPRAPRRDDVDRRLAMFAQVIQGRTSDPEAVRAATDRWMKDLAPGAIGWLGSTAGVTDDGQAVLVVRFESAEAAQQNAAWPEQDSFWQDTRR